VGKQIRLTAGYPPQPVHRPPAVTSQLLVFPHRPFHEDAIERVEGPVKRGLIVLPIVVYPSPKDWIVHSRQILQALIAPTVDAPAPHLSAHLFGCSITHCWNEADKLLPLPRLTQAWAKGEAQKVKFPARVVASLPADPAGDELRLLRVQFQPAL
jgi:hypothetical protein